MIDQKVQVRVAGLIYAGGRGMRLGGVDKALILHAGQPLIAHMRAALSLYADHIFITRQADQTDLSRYGEVLIDEEADQGPLTGWVQAALHARAAGFDYLLSAPVDCTALPENYLERLYEVRKPHAVFAVNEDIQPTFALYDLSAIDGACAAYVDGARKLRTGLEAAGYGVVTSAEALENRNDF